MVIFIKWLNDEYKSWTDKIEVKLQWTQLDLQWWNVGACTISIVQGMMTL